MTAFDYLRSRQSWEICSEQWFRVPTLLSPFQIPSCGRLYGGGIGSLCGVVVRSSHTSLRGAMDKILNICWIFFIQQQYWIQVLLIFNEYLLVSKENTIPRWRIRINGRLTLFEWTRISDASFWVTWSTVTSFYDYLFCILIVTISPVLLYNLE